MHACSPWVSGEVGWMGSTGETVEHRVSSVLEASVSGWSCQGLLMSVLPNFLGKESFSIYSRLSPNVALRYVMRQHCIYIMVDSISLTKNFFRQMVLLVVEGSVINRVYPIYFYLLLLLVNILFKKILYCTLKEIFEPHLVLKECRVWGSLHKHSYKLYLHQIFSTFFLADIFSFWY